MVHLPEFAGFTMLLVYLSIPYLQTHNHPTSYDLARHGYDKAVPQLQELQILPCILLTGYRRLHLKV